MSEIDFPNGVPRLLRRRVSELSSRALEIGKAAEHLVCADLILSGYRAFLADQGIPYDVVCDIDGRLIRIQVKSTMKPKPVPDRSKSGNSYQFHLKHAGHGAKRIISTTDFDIVALVAIDIRKIAYLVMADKVLQTLFLRIPGDASTHGNKRLNNIDKYPIQRALSELSA
jgi:hypothetical protein